MFLSPEQYTYADPPIADNFVFSADHGNDVIDGGDGDDLVDGDGGDDILFGGDGGDHMFGDASFRLEVRDGVE
ncbi:hypothetical protein HLB44_09305 [Aquincola sp. S2]|uniref:Calcium-binding protein n=1 Tax=Pseudaquabacterium terrae TaxID=2732868 RepID=A0ABX2EEZ8_9BURK|nr:hypothetical protein [Aquabacterium terrae]